MNFAVIDLKKKKSIKWQILKCHNFSGCSAQKPIWKCQCLSPRQPCEPGWLPRLWRIPGWIPVCFGFLRARPHVGTSALPASLGGVWGSAQSTRKVRGFFLAVLLVAGPPIPLARVTHQQHRVPWEQPAQTGEWWAAQSPYQQ